MASRAKGIIVEIGGDTSGLQKALEKVNSVTSSLNKELKKVNSSLKLDPKNTELLEQKQKLLNDEIAVTAKKLEEMKQHQEEVKNSGEVLTKEQQEHYRALQREIVNTEDKLKKLQLEASNWTQAGRKIEEFGNKVDNISSKIDKLGTTLTTRLTLPIAGIVATGIKYNAEIEKMTTAYETFLGNAEEAEKVVNQIKEDASKTPFDVTSLVRANQMLISTGENAEDSRETILALGDAVIATGGGNDELTRMASNLQQIKNAGKATAMDIRQFAYAGIDIYGLLADYTGKTTEEVKNMTVSYDVLSEALKKANKEGGKYYKAMDKASDTLEGQAKQLKAEAKAMAGELAKSLMPEVKRLLGFAKDLIGRFDKLSDEEKKNITNMVLLTAAIGPAIKILGTLGGGIGNTIKGIGTLSQAIGVLKTGAESSNAAANSLASGLKGLTSPAALATAGIALFTAAVVATKVNVDKEYESLTKLNQELKNNNEARKSAIEAIEKQRDTDLVEINNTKNLRKELGLLISENGKVKDGYEARARFILGELNKALGTEYSMTGNVIDNYQNLMSTIDDLIAKKKAQIILEANEEAYAEAIKNKDKLYKDYIKTQEELASKLQRLNELQEESKNGFIGSKQSMAYNAMETKKLSEEINNLSDNLKSEKETLGKYSTEIENYQKNSELMLEGGIENYKKIEQSVSTTQQNITKLANAGLNERLKAQIEANEQSKKEFDLEVKYNKDAKNSIYAENVKKGQENLKALSDELIARTSTIGILGEDEINAWRTLADGSYNEYKEAISKMSPKMQNEINLITGNIRQDTSVENAMQDLAERTEAAYNRNVNGAKWGRDLTEEMSNGMTSQRSKSMLERAGGIVAGWISSFLHFSVPDKGPLADMDESMPDMIDLMAKGMLSNKYKLVNSAQSLAKGLNDALDIDNSKIIGFNASGFNKKMNSTNTVFTTPQIVFNVQELDEAKLQQCFNYINRKFGSQY